MLFFRVIFAFFVKVLMTKSAVQIKHPFILHTCSTAVKECVSPACKIRIQSVNLKSCYRIDIYYIYLFNFSLWCFMSMCILVLITLNSFSHFDVLVSFSFLSVLTCHIMESSGLRTLMMTSSCSCCRDSLGNF